MTSKPQKQPRQEKRSCLHSSAIIAAIITGVFAVIAACIGAVATMGAGFWVLVEPTEPRMYEQPTVSVAEGGPTAGSYVEPTATIVLQRPTIMVEEGASLTPQPQPTVPSLVVASFSDDFNDGASVEWVAHSGTWRVVNGQYTADYTRGLVYSLVGDIGWRDYAVDVDVTSSCQAGYPIAILVRSVDPGNGVQMQVDCCHVRWVLYEHGDSRTIAALDTPTPLRYCVGHPSWKTTHIRVEVKGDFYSVYLDGIHMLDVQDSVFGYGRAGVGLSCPPGEGYCPRFDNFEVSVLP